ncbi:MAG: beta-ketoacyl-ACP synthase III [Verrucomicrobiota bacterium]
MNKSSSSRKRPPQPISVTVAGTGGYVPSKVLSNQDLERMVETSDEWILTRTGIRERRIAGDEELSSDMGAAAAREALREAEVHPAEVDLIVVATTTPDHTFPATAAYIQQKIGATNAACYDIMAACAGFLVGLIQASHFLATGSYRNILVIGAEKLSAITNWEDRNTCVLFGDGAGAALLQPREAGQPGGLLAFDMGTDGAQTDILLKPGGGCAIPLSEEVLTQHLDTIVMSGKEVYRHAVTAMNRSAEKTLAIAGLTGEDIAWVIPHQANLRIINAVAERLGLPMDRFLLNLEHYGNTSAACIPLALATARREGRLQPGDKLLMVAFGSGLTWASLVLEW